MQFTALSLGIRQVVRNTVQCQNAAFQTFYLVSRLNKQLWDKDKAERVDTAR